MKIALIGYGKMGHAIERIASRRGHQIVCTIDTGEDEKFDSPEFIDADVAIEFTMPSAAVANYRRALGKGIKVVSGTTGWTSALPEVKEIIENTGGTLFWSSNFSIGVNIFMKINAYAASLMSRFGQYIPAMKEIHHIHKLDHPSGTAITLAETIISNHQPTTGWTEAADGDTVDNGIIPISHERTGEVPGTHIVSWTSPVDTVTLEHRAFSRDGFALGAVVAAEWLNENPAEKGLIGMEKLLD
ncbi:MAG: 4-hydroxy-tetrahydrodipicolinate reductase [Bacteroidales bacterium]|nr:4-hydroxy-tetrahydrodipicolinate reductase [Bacteroidales bacterium]